MYKKNGMWNAGIACVEEMKHSCRTTEKRIIFGDLYQMPSVGLQS